MNRAERRAALKGRRAVAPADVPARIDKALTAADRLTGLDDGVHYDTIHTDCFTGVITGFRESPFGRIAVDLTDALPPLEKEWRSDRPNGYWVGILDGKVATNMPEGTYPAPHPRALSSKPFDPDSLAT